MFWSELSNSVCNRNYHDIPYSFANVSRIFLKVSLWEWKENRSVKHPICQVCWNNLYIFATLRSIHTCALLGVNFFSQQIIIELFSSCRSWPNNKFEWTHLVKYNPFLTKSSRLIKCKCEWNLRAEFVLRITQLIITVHKFVTNFTHLDSLRIMPHFASRATWAGVR